MFKEFMYRGFVIKINEDGTVIYRDGKLLNINTSNKDGYLTVSMANRTERVHRLVALAYIHNPNPKEKNEVNHINFKRDDNHYKNLEWLSHQENVKHSQMHGRYKKPLGKDNANYGNRKLSKFYKDNPHIALEKQSRKGTQNGRATPIEIYKDDKLINSFDYIGECCEYLHINYGFPKNPESIRSSIRKSMKNNKPYKGFTFKKTKRP